MCITLKYVHLDNDFDLHSLNDIGGVMVSVLASSAVDRSHDLIIEIKKKTELKFIHIDV
jgi:hypothetical protein